MALVECSSSSGGDYSDLQYENYTAGNIKKNVAVKVKDPDGNVIKSETGSYEVNTFTNLTAANVKKSTKVTIKDTDNTTLKAVTGTYNGPESVAYLFHAVLGTSGSGAYSYTTTRAYSWIIIASAASDSNAQTATPSHTCGGTQSTTYGSSTATLWGSSVGLRLSLYKNVPNGSTISCSKTAGGPHCHYAIGIY